MFAPARDSAKTQISKSSAVDEIPQLPSTSLPEEYSLAQLAEECICIAAHENELQNLVILSNCLSNSERLQRSDGDEEHIAALSSWLSRAILPTAECVTEDDAPESLSAAARQQFLHIARQRAILGLKSLHAIFSLTTSVPESNTLISILAHTSPQDPWITPLSLSLTSSLLSLPSLEAKTSSPDFIPTLLQTFIRPLFSASAPATITASGRKAAPSSAPPKRLDFTNERVGKPWRYERPWSVAVLEWALTHISSTTTSQTWPLILPPLLTLLDSPSPSLLPRGLKLTAVFLPKLTPSLLSQTGLSSVFEDAILPTLMHLPSTTPLPDSLRIVTAGYEALWALYGVMFDHHSSSETEPGSKVAEKNPNEKRQKGEVQRLRFLDTVLRKGILSAAFHASNHPAIITLLIAQLRVVVQKQGIHAVKHLKDIIPLLSSVLTDPFGNARMDGLLEALKTLRVVVLCCWVRVGGEEWRQSCVGMLVLCWKAVEEGAQGTRGEQMAGKVKEEIRVVGRLLVKAVQQLEVTDFKMELRPLLDIDEAAGEIFGFDDTV
ncbi:hypothetical protein BUE80_DR012439 [Diplocarpon rosae]|nr:hypothetical protein BUE80_DR012439 [Diplocarpon rosae]